MYDVFIIRLCQQAVWKSLLWYHRGNSSLKYYDWFSKSFRQTKKKKKTVDEPCGALCIYGETSEYRPLKRRSLIGDVRYLEGETKRISYFRIAE